MTPTNSITLLINILSARIPMSATSFKGEENNRIIKLVPECDKKERLIYWRGNDPKETEISSIAEEIIAHLELR